MQQMRSSHKLNINSKVILYRMMSILLVYLVLSSFALVVTAVPSQNCVTQYCQCADNPDGYVKAKCKIQKLGDLKFYITAPRNVSSL